jgi:hypothetical protein
MNLDEIYVKSELGTKELAERQMASPRRAATPYSGRWQAYGRPDPRTRQSVPCECRRVRGSRARGPRHRLFGARSTAQADPVPAERSADEVQDFLDAQKALSNAINEHMGFRGYGLMMRLQKAENLRDLHEMLSAFAQALVKRKGMEAATPIVSALEQMIVRRP